jgi:hypothetical protein
MPTLIVPTSRGVPQRNFWTPRYLLSLITLSPINRNASITLSSNRLSASGTLNSQSTSIRCDTPVTSTMAIYVEATLNALDTNGEGIGMANSSATWTANNYAPGANDANGIILFTDGSIQNNNGASVGTMTAVTVGTVISMAYSGPLNKVWFRRDANNWDDVSGDNPATNTGGFATGLTIGSGLFIFGTVDFDNTTHGMLTFNFQGPFVNSVPAGFNGL